MPLRNRATRPLRQAMNAGHDGSLTTIHASRPRDAIMRLEVIVGLAANGRSARSIRRQVSSAIDLFIHPGDASRTAPGASRM